MMARYRMLAPRHMSPSVVELSGGVPSLHVPPSGVVEIETTREQVDPAEFEPHLWTINHDHLRELLALGFRHAPDSGTERPAAGRYDGEQYFDETLGRPVWWSRGSWRGADGEPA